MAQSKNKSSATHRILKIAVILFMLAFFVNIGLSENLPIWGYAIMGATFVGIAITIVFINYTDFQRYGFLPVILISLFEIGKHLSSPKPAENLESIYYVVIILISLYFIIRVKKKKYHSHSR